MKDITIETYQEAIKVLSLCKTPHGFHAAHPGYNALWARDSMITSLGASLVKSTNFQNTFKQSLNLLAKHQSKKGQIPNAILLHEKPKKTDYKSIDSSCWFIIGNEIYKKRYNFQPKLSSQINKALNWLSFQDMGEDHMLEQLPTTDWQDAFPHRYGHTINTQALYYKVLTLTKNNKEAKLLKHQVNNNKDDRLWNGNFYYPWRWKNHNKYKELGEWFDSLGNLLAIVFDLATSQQANKILSHIKKKNIAYPFPIKAIYPPIRPKTKDWQPYFKDSEAGTPNHYSNGGIWTFIGGFYVLALIKQKKFNEANVQLNKLAQANLQKPLFSEWHNGVTGKPGHSESDNKQGNQAWNAGMYILAFESLMRKKVML
jgi:glycogen debranching enzyme